MSVILLFDTAKYQSWTHAAWDITEEEKFMDEKEKQVYRNSLEHNQIRNMRSHSETENFFSRLSMCGVGPQSIELELNDKVVGFCIVIDGDKGLLQYENGKLQWLYDSVFYDIDLSKMTYTTDATASDIEMFIRTNFDYWVLEDSEYYDIEQFIPIVQRNIPIIVRMWLENVRNFAKKLGKTKKINREQNWSNVDKFVIILDKLLE